MERLTCTRTSVLADFQPAAFVGAAGAGLPRTGAYIAPMALLALGLIVVGDVMRRRARKAGNRAAQ